MLIKFEIKKEENKIVLGVTPKNKVINGISIVYGEEQIYEGTAYTPAITRDALPGVVEYDLPPEGAIDGFHISKIKEVALEDKALDMISRYGA